MTREQKRLLWTVPVAVALFGGLIAYQYDRMGKVTDRLVEVPTTPPPNVEQVRRATEQLQAASDLAILNASERQLVKDEEFVRSVETAYPALRQARRDEERKRVDEQVDNAAASLGGRLATLRGIRSEGLPPADRVRLAAAQSLCAELIDRLGECREQ